MRVFSVFLVLVCVSTISVFMTSSKKTEVLIVEVDEGSILETKNRILKMDGVLSLDRFSPSRSSYFDRLIEVTVESGFEISLLEEVVGVVRVERSYKVTSFGIEPASGPFNISDSFFGYQWGLSSTDQVVRRDLDDTHAFIFETKEEADIAWTLDKSRKVDSSLKRDVVVALIDSGVSTDHPELKDQILLNEAECEDGRMPTGKAEDKDGNGFPGDCMGWNFSEVQPLRARLVNDDSGHGTHMAGIIAAKQDNEEGISGISSRIKILPVKIYGSRDMRARQGKESRAGSYTERVAKGILYAADRGVDVINLSLGWPAAVDTKYVREAFAYAWSKGVTIVAAAGNNDSVFPVFPCAYEGVICVGSHDIDNTMSEFSNFGGHVDVVAPGDNVLSTYPELVQQLHFGVRGFEILNGTSFSAPVIAAFSALLKGLKPGISDDEILSKLVLGSKEVDEEHRYILTGAPKFDLFLNEKLSREYIIPKLKSLHQVPINSSGDPVFQLSFPIQNLSEREVVADVTIELDDSNGLSIENNRWTQIELKHLEKKSIRVKGKVTDLGTNSERTLLITINAGDFSKTFKHKIVLVKELEAKSAVVTAFPKSKEPVNSLLVKEIGPSSGVPEFFQSVKIKSRNHLRLIRPFGDRKSIEKDLSHLGDTVSILGLWRLDLNSDASQDYFLQVFVQNESEGEVLETKLLYLYLDKNLQPLLGGQSTFDLVWAGILVPQNIQDVAFLPVNSNDFGKIRVPVFQASALITESDLNPDFFSFESNDPKKHIYYFEPQIIAGESRFVTRTFDNYKLNKSIRKELGAKTKSQITFENLLPQSAEQFERGEVNSVFVFGKHNLKTAFRLGIDEKLLNSRIATPVRILSGDWQISRRLVKPISHLSEGKKKTEGYSLVSFYTPIIGQILSLDEEAAKVTTNHRIESRDLEDHFDKFIQGYVSKKGYSFFYTSVGKLKLLFVPEEGKVSELSTTVDRSSFLPGRFYSQIMYPSEVVEEGDLKPAVYVDSSPLTSNRVFFWQRVGDKLVAPIKRSSSVPDDCRPLLPVLAENPARVFLSFQCEREEKTTLELYQLAN